jgi:hypothetical protein
LTNYSGFTFLSLQAFGTFDDIKLHLLTLLQAAETARLNGRKMDEQISLAFLTTDKTVPEPSQHLHDLRNRQTR